MNHYDIVIIGSGTGGSTLAYKLAPSGKKILIIERGNFIPKEKQNWDPNEVMTKGRYRVNEEWLDADNKSFKPFLHYAVGGNSKMYGAAMFRFREKDFKEVKHFGGISPEWPINYSTLEPYYTEAEKLYSVHGKKGIDPTEPKKRPEFPYAPLPYEPFIQDLSLHFQKIGLKPFPLPMAIKLPQEISSNNSPVILENFDGYPDPTDTKADAQTTCLNKALNFKNVSLITNACVEKLITDSAGKKITSLMMVVNDERVIISSDCFVLACGAVNSAVLLLKSGNHKFPNGLANSSDMVGRNLMLHHNGCLIAFTNKKNDSTFQKSFGIADYYFANNESEFPLGEIQLMGKNDPDTLLWAAEKHFPGKSYEEIKNKAIDFWLTAEDLPSEENRVTINNDGKIKINYVRNNYKAFELLKQKLKDSFDKIGELDKDFSKVKWAGYDLDVSGMSHQNGTLKMGTNSKNSVVNIHCQSHDIKNLFVADASFFPSSGAFNPALTIAANALRVGDYILNNYETI